MGAFNFIESFFLLSLGITFVLIVLLVYHFKQRLSSMEQKCDTMFDIVQNLVKELKVVKTACLEQPFTCSRMDPACMILESDGNEDEDEDEDEDDDDDSDVDNEDSDGDNDDDDEHENETDGDVKIINMSIGDIIDIIETQSNESESDEALVELDVTEPVPSVHKIVVTDYKKMTVAELKHIVSSQNLATNASKLTKTELLKLLEK